MMSLQNYKSTRETTNLARVARMILGPCTGALCALLTKEVTPSALIHNVKTFIANYPKHRPCPINKEQEKLVCGGNYSEFDIALLYTLIRNVSAIPQHLNNWGNDPQPGDRSVSANIERIRLIRNQDGHSSATSLTDRAFNKKCKDIVTIIQELEAYLGADTIYQDAVAYIKTCSMDPEQEAKYINELLDVNSKLDYVLEEVQKTKTTSVPHSVRALYERDISNWKEDDRVFVETHNFPVMLEQARSQPYVTFVGAPGSGKTATVRHIALILQKEGYDIFPIKEINKIEDYCDQQAPQVFVIDDVFGVFGLNEHELYMINKYSDRLNDPINPNTKTLMTCREAIFRHKMLSHCIFAKKDNVVNLQNQENALNSDDKQNLLEKYRLNKDILSPSDLALSSSMFPLLCKLFSNEKEMDVYGPTFFISPVPCILEQLNLLEIRNKYHYVSLVLLMANENRLSENILDNENDGTNENQKRNNLFGEIKRNILRRCEVPSTTDSFQLLNALSEMEGTYTKKSDTEFVFIHDSMFEIVAYHFGRKFPELILQFASSNYIANYITVDKDNSQKRNRGHDNEKIIDLCIQLHESKYPQLAGRLFKDVQNGEFYNVFSNEALKNSCVLQNFIAEMEKTNYDYLQNLLLSEKIWKYELKQIDVKNEKHVSLTRVAHRCLVNKKEIDGEFRNTVRGIAWVILFGHYGILQSFFNLMTQRKEIKDEPFHNCFEKCPQPYSNMKENVTGTERDIKTYDKLFSKTNIDIDDKVDVIYRRQPETTNKTYNTQVIVEQCRLLCLACYSCDLNTVQTLLKHVTTDALNSKDWPLTASHSKSPLIIACTNGYLDIVMELIEAGADVNACFFFETPLTAACKNGKHSIVRVLLQSGAYVNYENSIYTPLQCACQNGHTLLVKELIKAGADVNLSIYGHSPLFAACNKRHYNVVKELILAGVDVNKQENKETVLIVCDGGYFKLLKLLMKSGIEFDLNDKDKTTLNYPFYWDHLNIVKKLIEMESLYDLNDTHEMSLTAECYRGHLEEVKEMIKGGTTVNMKAGDKTPLIVACYKEHSLVVKELIEAGADVNLQNEYISPLQVACYEGHLSIVKELTKTEFEGNQISSVGKALVGACFFGHFSVVKELIACHVEVNLIYGKETPLTTTCYMGHLNIFKELIIAGADVNLNSGIITPLTSSCCRGHINIISELIKEGADINQNDGNKTPLTAACETGYMMVVKNLIDAGAVVNQSDGKKTPLTAACEIGHLDLVEYLLDAGADVNQSDGKKTPLTAACEIGHLDLVEYLLDAGADVNQSDGKKTPLTAACEIGHLDLVEYLLDAGADVNQSDGINTPLTAAEKREHWEEVSELLDVSADVNQSDGNNSLPTVERTQLDNFQELLLSGAEFEGLLLPGHSINTSWV